jgi:hypothetical protein
MSRLPGAKESTDVCLNDWNQKSYVCSRVANYEPPIVNISLTTVYKRRRLDFQEEVYRLHRGWIVRMYSYKILIHNKGNDVLLPSTVDTRLYILTLDVPRV